MKINSTLRMFAPVRQASDDGEEPYVLLNEVEGTFGMAEDAARETDSKTGRRWAEENPWSVRRVRLTVEVEEE